MRGNELQRSLVRALWIQDFADRLAGLGAPGSLEAFIALGTERYVSDHEMSACQAAERIWLEWDTETGTGTN